MRRSDVVGVALRLICDNIDSLQPEVDGVVVAVANMDDGDAGEKVFASVIVKLVEQREGETAEQALKRLRASTEGAIVTAM